LAFAPDRKVRIWDDVFSIEQRAAIYAGGDSMLTLLEFTPQKTPKVQEFESTWTYCRLYVEVKFPPGT